MLKVLHLHGNKIKIDQPYKILPDCVYADTENLGDKPLFSFSNFAAVQTAEESTAFL